MADSRLTPARPDLAAAHLRGRVEAARYVEGEACAILPGRASLRRRPSSDAAQDSELLLGEPVTVYERKDGWAWVQAQNDSYVGYVQEAALGPAVVTDARVILPLTPLLSAPDVKSPLRDLIPLNATVKRGAAHGSFVEAAGGFVHGRALAALDQTAADFVAVAEQYLGVPYVWGGKSFEGLDCSGLLQIALQAAGMASPRDTDMMENDLGQTIARQNPRRGDLVFWKGHVGVMRDSEMLLHANAHFMQATSEPLVVARTRITTPVTSVKRL